MDQYQPLPWYRREIGMGPGASRNIQDMRVETGKIDKEYKQIMGVIEQDAAIDLGPDIAKSVMPEMFKEATSPRQRLEWARKLVKEIQKARKDGYSYWQGGAESGSGARGY
jgi:hypothetical protein